MASHDGKGATDTWKVIAKKQKGRKGKHRKYGEEEDE